MPPKNLTAISQGYFLIQSVRELYQAKSEKKCKLYILGDRDLLNKFFKLIYDFRFVTDLIIEIEEIINQDSCQLRTLQNLESLKVEVRLIDDPEGFVDNLSIYSSLKFLEILSENYRDKYNSSLKQYSAITESINKKILEIFNLNKEIKQFLQELSNFSRDKLNNSNEDNFTDLNNDDIEFLISLNCKLQKYNKEQKFNIELSQICLPQLLYTLADQWNIVTIVNNNDIKRFRLVSGLVSFNPNECDGNNRLIDIAVRNDYIDMIKLLLQQGVDLICTYTLTNFPQFLDDRYCNYLPNFPFGIIIHSSNDELKSLFLNDEKVLYDGLAWFIWLNRLDNFNLILKQKNIDIFLPIPTGEFKNFTLLQLIFHCKRLELEYELFYPLPLEKRIAFANQRYSVSSSFLCANWSLLAWAIYQGHYEELLNLFPQEIGAEQINLFYPEQNALPNYSNCNAIQLMLYGASKFLSKTFPYEDIEPEKFSSYTKCLKYLIDFYKMDILSLTLYDKSNKSELPLIFFAIKNKIFSVIQPYINPPQENLLKEVAIKRAYEEVYEEINCLQLATFLSDVETFLYLFNILQKNNLLNSLISEPISTRFDINLFQYCIVFQEVQILEKLLQWPDCPINQSFPNNHPHYPGWLPIHLVILNGIAYRNYMGLLEIRQDLIINIPFPNTGKPHFLIGYYPLSALFFNDNPLIDSNLPSYNISSYVEHLLPLIKMAPKLEKQEILFQALFYALKHHRSSVGHDYCKYIKLLIEHGADPSKFGSNSEEKIRSIAKEKGLLHLLPEKSALLNLEEENLITHPFILFYRNISHLILALHQTSADIIANPNQFGLQAKGLSYAVIKAHREGQMEANLIGQIQKISVKELSMSLGEVVNKEGGVHEGFNALHWSAAFNYPRLAQYLIFKGFEQQFNGRNSLGLTPMQTAVVAGSRDFFMARFARIPEFSEINIQFINQEQVKVDITFNELHLALISQQVDLVRDIFSTLTHHHQRISTEIKGIGNLLHLLVYIGVNITQQANDTTENARPSVTPIDVVDLLQLLMQQNFFNEVLIKLLTESTNNHEGFSPLSLAAKHGQVGLIHALINYLKIHVNEVNGLGEIIKAFYVAAEHGQNEAVEYFINFHHFRPSNHHLLYGKTIEQVKEKDKKEPHYGLILGLIQRAEREAAHQLYLPPDPATQSYENLVLCGGGGKGFIFPYALQALERYLQPTRVSAASAALTEEDSLASFHTIRRVAGTSAGAMFAFAFAFALALGYSPKELEGKLATNFAEFLESDELEQITQQWQSVHPDNKEILTSVLKQLNLHIERIKGVTSEAQQGTMKGVWASIKQPFDLYNEIKKAIEQIKQLNQNFKGISSGGKGYAFLKRLLSDKHLPETLTFGELTDLINQDVNQVKGYKHLHVAVTNLTQNNFEVLSSENSLYKNYIILDAVRASMSYPIVFSPHHLRMKEGAHIRTLADEYIDGGVLRNYPIDEFDFKKYTDTDYVGDPKFPDINKSTLGFNFNYQVAPVEHSSESLVSRFMEFLGLYSQAETLISAHVDKEYHRSIILDTKHITTFTFKTLTDEDKSFLRQQSNSAVDDYFKTRLSSVSEMNHRFFTNASSSSAAAAASTSLSLNLDSSGADSADLSRKRRAI